jgi:hypothetical protein
MEVGRGVEAAAVQGSGPACSPFLLLHALGAREMVESAAGELLTPQTKDIHLHGHRCMPCHAHTCTCMYMSHILVHRHVADTYVHTLNSPPMLMYIS